MKTSTFSMTFFSQFFFFRFLFRWFQWSWIMFYSFEFLSQNKILFSFHFILIQLEGIVKSLGFTHYQNTFDAKDQFSQQSGDVFAKTTRFSGLQRPKSTQFQNIMHRKVFTSSQNATRQVLFIINRPKFTTSKQKNISISEKNFEWTTNTIYKLKFFSQNFVHIHV